MSSDEPVLTDYPHDRLTRLAAAMGDAFSAQPGTKDIRAIVLLNDSDGGCVYAHGYPAQENERNILMVADVAEHLYKLGQALGAKVDIVINGNVMPGMGG